MMMLLGGGTALVGQLYQNTALLELLSESKMLFSASLAESLSHRRVKCPLFCLYNIKDASALISIKRTIGLNYVYDCPLELPSMPFSLSAFSKPLSPQEVYVRGIQCRQFRRHKRALHQKAIPLLCDLWLCWGGRLNPCGHPVSSSQGNRIDSKSAIRGGHVSRHPGKWQLIVFHIYTFECSAWVVETPNPAKYTDLSHTWL